MPDEYKGCRVMSALPYAFNDFGHMAGMSRDLAFDDIAMVIKGLNAGNPEVPDFHAIVLAFSEQFHYQPVGKPSSIKDDDFELITFSPDVRQIPDVYAFLHAVLNSSPDTATVPKSTLHDMLGRCRAVPKRQRTAILKAAADLRRAYLPAITNSKWAALQPATRRQLPASSQAATAAPHDVPRFFVFVQSIVMKSILLIDGEKIIPLARTTEHSPPGVLCDKVINAIDSLRKAAGPDIESCVLGLSTRTAC